MVEGKIIVHSYSSIIARNKEGKYLTILEKDNKGWFCPCGHAEAGESFQQAGIREAKEESGIDVEIKGVLRLRSKAKVDGHLSMTCIFYAEPKDENQKPKEIEDNHSLLAKWFSLEELEKLKDSPPGFRDKDFLEWAKYLENGGQIFPHSVLSELYSDFPEKYDEAFTVAKPQSEKHFGILKNLIPNIKERLSIEVIGNQKYLFSTSPFESLEVILKEIKVEDMEMIKQEYKLASFFEVIASQLKAKNPAAKRVKIVGSEELCQEIRKTGLECDRIEEPDKGMQIINSGGLESYPIDTSIDLLLISLDSSFNFFKQCAICMYAQKGVKIVAASDELTIDCNGIKLPGTQKLVNTVRASLETSAPQIEALIRF